MAFAGSRHFDSFESIQMCPFKFSPLHLFLSVLNLYPKRSDVALNSTYVGIQQPAVADS